MHLNPSCTLQAGKPPDFFYCKSLLEAKGIVTVPGTGFKQAEGTLHFRTTILPPESDIEATAKDITDFHKDFMAKVMLPWSCRLLGRLSLAFTNDCAVSTDGCKVVQFDWHIIQHVIPVCSTATSDCDGGAF